MSDIISTYQKSKLESKLSISTEFPFCYIKKETAQNYEFVFCVSIPWSLLCLWTELIQKARDSNVRLDVSYIDLLNASVVDGWFAIKRESQRIEDLLYKMSRTASKTIKRQKGRRKNEFQKRVYKLNVRRFEAEKVGSSVYKSELEQAKREIEEWKKRYNDLAAEKEQLYNDMLKEINVMKEEITDLKQVNKELAEYIEMLEKDSSLRCIGHGKKHHELGAKQKGRRLHLLKSKAQRALWFCKSFGLDLEEIKFQDNDGAHHSIRYNSSTPSGYKNLSEDDKNTIEQLLFLLDKFCVGDEVYHELSMISEGLPKSYLVKQKRNQMNKLYHIESLPGIHPGAMINFTSTLQDHIRDLLSKKPELKQETIQIKLSGDGARMSRTTNFMLMSFTLLQLKEDVMSPKHNKTVAIINGPEYYETLKASLNNFFKEVNGLIKRGKLSVDGEEVKLDFFLGGDLKFLLLILGLNSASSDYACLWCTVHKNDRWDMSKPMNYYNEKPHMRTIEDIKTLWQCDENFGCIHEPLLDIPVTNVIPDELHLLLRITDRILQNVIDEVLERDAIDDFQKARGQPKGVFIAKLITSINDLGISFSIWNKKNADGSESQIKDFTSLLGSQKKKLLKGFPSKLHDFLYPETCSTVKKIWTDFALLYDKISDFNLTKNEADVIFSQAKSWIDLFCSLRGVRPGYNRTRVTPYMHLIPYHLPFFVQRHGCLKQFTGQGVEKNNDEAKKIFFNKSNRWDAVRDILQTESRQWDLRHQERQKAQYTKRKLEFWGQGISQARKQRKQEIDNQYSSVTPEDNMSSSAQAENYSTLTIKQLKDIVKNRGLKPKGLSKMKKKQLIELLYDT